MTLWYKDIGTIHFSLHLNSIITVFMIFFGLPIKLKFDVFYVCFCLIPLWTNYFMDSVWIFIWSNCVICIVFHYLMFNSTQSCYELLTDCIGTCKSIYHMIIEQYGPSFTQSNSLLFAITPIKCQIVIARGKEVSFL